jgi:hypothetical protein
MRRWGGFLGLALLLALASMANAANAAKDAPGDAKALHVTYYFLPG